LPAKETADITINSSRSSLGVYASVPGHVLGSFSGKKELGQFNGNAQAGIRPAAPDYSDEEDYDDAIAGKMIPLLSDS
jgi:hypothetical protein